MTRFIGDTVHILYLLAALAISLGLNLTTTTLRLGIAVIEAYATTLSLVIAAYTSRINEVLHPGAPKGVTIQ